MRGYRSRSKSRGGFCSNHSRSCSGVSWRKSGVSSSTSSPSGGGSSGLGLGRVLDRRLVERDLGLGLRRVRRLGLRRAGSHRLGLLGLGLGGLRGAGAGSPGAGASANSARCWRRPQRLRLLAGDLLGVRAPAALELEVLPDGVVEQSHLAVKAYSALTVRFFPERLAR